MQPYAIRFTSLDNKTMQTQSKKGYLQHSIAKMRRKVQTIKDCSIFMDNNIAKSIVQNCTALQQCSAVVSKYYEKTLLKYTALYSTLVCNNCKLKYIQGKHYF